MVDLLGFIKLLVLAIGGAVGFFFLWLGLISAFTPRELWEYGRQNGLRYNLRTSCFEIVPKGWTPPGALNERIDLINSQWFVKYLTVLCVFLWWLFICFFEKPFALLLMAVFIWSLFATPVIVRFIRRV